MEHIDKIKALAKDKKVVFVYGKFNILHAGHLRLLKFAKDCGDFLVVGVDNYNIRNLIEADLRLEALKYSHFIDYPFLLDIDQIEFISKLKPSIVVKGSEHEEQENPELEILKSYGGKLIFTSGSISISTLDLLKNEINSSNELQFIKPQKYLSRRNIEKDKLLKIIDNFKNLNIIVIGDTIIDEYIVCEPLGMSQEDPTIVVSPISSDKYLGGAGIVAAHSVGLGANVSFFTVVGDDDSFIHNKLKEYGVNAYIYNDSSRPTTLKQRYRAKQKTLLRVNHLKQHHIDKNLQDKIFEDIKSIINTIDLIVFSDFSYGCLPQRLIDKITKLCLEHNKIMVADSQSSSQTGDISRFNNMFLVTPTEREIRLSLNDFESGLIVLAEKLREKANIQNVFVTLGADGILIHQDDILKVGENGKWITDKIEPLNTSPKDVAGAGDSLLIASSMAIVSDASIMESAYIGSIAAAIQVSRIGNIPLTIEEIIHEIKK